MTTIIVMYISLIPIQSKGNYKQTECQWGYYDKPGYNLGLAHIAKYNVYINVYSEGNILRASITYTCFSSYWNLMLLTWRWLSAIIILHIEMDITEVTTYALPLFYQEPALGVTYFILSVLTHVSGTVGNILTIIVLQRVKVNTLYISEYWIRSSLRLGILVM